MAFERLSKELGVHLAALQTQLVDILVNDWRFKINQVHKDSSEPSKYILEICKSKLKMYQILQKEG